MFHKCENIKGILVIHQLKLSEEHRLCVNPIQTGGGGAFRPPPLRQNRDNSYTEEAMTFKFSDFS